MYQKEYDPLFEFWVPGVFLSGGLISRVLIPKFLIYKCFINTVNKTLIIPLPQLKALFINFVSCKYFRCGVCWTHWEPVVHGDPFQVKTNKFNKMTPF